MPFGVPSTKVNAKWAMGESRVAFQSITGGIASKKNNGDGEGTTMRIEEGKKVKLFGGRCGLIISGGRSQGPRVHKRGRNGDHGKGYGNSPWDPRREPYKGKKGISFLGTET